MLSCPHSVLTEIKVRTARCDSCDKRNDSKLFRCKGCGVQNCAACNGQILSGQSLKEVIPAKRRKAVVGHSSGDKAVEVGSCQTNEPKRVKRTYSMTNRDEEVTEHKYIDSPKPCGDSQDKMAAEHENVPERVNAIQSEATLEDSRATDIAAANLLLNLGNPLLFNPNYKHTVVVRRRGSTTVATAWNSDRLPREPSRGPFPLMDIDIGSEGPSSTKSAEKIVKVPARIPAETQSTQLGTRLPQKQQTDDEDDMLIASSHPTAGNAIRDPLSTTIITDNGSESTETNDEHHAHMTIVQQPNDMTDNKDSGTKVVREGRAIVEESESDEDPIRFRRRRSRRKTECDIALRYQGDSDSDSSSVTAESEEDEPTSASSRDTSPEPELKWRLRTTRNSRRSQSGGSKTNGSLESKDREPVLKKGVTMIIPPR